MEQKEEKREDRKSRFTENEERTSLKKRKGKVSNITPLWVIINVNGSGERIQYNKEKHSGLKIGDVIDI